jgi:cob(I)alamin adenosyltransferase
MVHVILTGRNAHPALVELADTVTEMREVKHGYQRGIQAQKGIEF